MLEQIIEKHSKDWVSDNFDGWKITEIMYCKIGWCIDALDGSDDLDYHAETLLRLQRFIEDLQKIEQI